MFANINGTRIFFDVEGVGFESAGPGLLEKPVCFVLHGGPGGTHAIYKPNLSPLADYMQLVYIDNRGSGYSDRGPQSTYTLENNIEDLEALRKYLGLEKIVLFGQSYGGMVALSYAAKYTDQVAGLLLVTTSPSYRFIEGAKRILSEKGTPEQQKMGQLVWDGAFESDEQLLRFYEVMAPLYSYRKQKELEETPLGAIDINPTLEMSRPEAERVESQTGSLNELKPKTLRSFEALNEGFGGFLREYDVIGELPHMMAPALIIGARHDWITPVEESYTLAKYLPNNELIILEESSHSVFRDQYDQFIGAALDFIKRKLATTSKQAP
jgi:proline iminopeptidase